MVSSLMKRWFGFSADLAISLFWTALVALVVTVPLVRESFLRNLIAGPYLLVVPGYTLVAVLFPRDGEISPIERGTFSIGASIAVTMLWGIVLTGTPWGLTQLTLLTEGLLAVTLVVAADYRRTATNQQYQKDGINDPSQRRVQLRRFGQFEWNTARESTEQQPDTRHGPVDPYSRITTAAQRAWDGRDAVGGGSRVLQVAIVAAVLLSAGAAAYAIETPLPSERYTEFYVLGSNGTVESIPSNASAGESIALTVEVINHEHEKLQYGLQIQSNNTEGNVTVLQTAEKRLVHGESWERQITPNVPPNASHVKYEMLLFRGEPPGNPIEPSEAYRSVQVVVTVNEPEDTFSLRTGLSCDNGVRRGS